MCCVLPRAACHETAQRLDRNRRAKRVDHCLVVDPRSSSLEIKSQHLAIIHLQPAQPSPLPTPPVAVEPLALPALPVPILPTRP